MTDGLRQQVLADETVPEPLRRALEGGLPLEEIRLDPHGRWWHRGARIEHRRIHELFSRSVDATEGGTWVLKIGRFTYPIIVDDTPCFIASAMPDETTGAVQLTLTDGTQEPLDGESLRLDGAGRLLVRVKEGRLQARFLRRAYHDLVDYFEESEDGYLIVVGDRRIAVSGRATGVGSG